MTNIWDKYMENSYYLSNGYLLGGHYEIVKVLGEDEFEILYLVKDRHRLESLFVIKELFLKAYARRENETVHVMAKSKLLFEDTKKELISEITIAQKKSQTNLIQIYGYLEENNTVYTIMEFINDSNVAHYLQNNFQNENENEDNRDKIVLPPIENHKKNSIKKDTQSATKSSKVKETPTKKEQKNKSHIFLKILSVSVLIMVGLLYYSWNMIKADKERAKEHKVSVITTSLHDRKKESIKKEESIKKDASAKEESIKKEEPFNAEEAKHEEKKERPFNASYIEEGEQETEKNDDLTNIPNEDSSVKEVGESIPPVNQSNTNSLGTQIGGVNRTAQFNRVSVKRFLDNFLDSSTSGSIDDIVSQYDTKVDRYFSLKNVDHSKIRKDKVNYQKRWTRRDYQLVAFKIVRIYRKDNFDYCDVSTNIQWNVSSDDFKTSAGRSKGFMTIKRTYNGFKVTSIYTVK